MKQYVDWFSESYLPTHPLARKWYDAKNLLQGKPLTNWSAEDQAVKDKAQRDAQKQMSADPNVQQQKFQKLKVAFQQALAQEVQINRPQLQVQVERALSNLAQAFTMGQQMRGGDLDRILVAIHQDKKVPKDVKLGIFSDHDKLSYFFQQVFNQHPETWYYPQATTVKERMHPQTNFNADEYHHYKGAWQNSPFRYTGPLVKPKAKSQAQAQQSQPSTAVEATIDMFATYQKPVKFDVLYHTAQQIYDKAMADGQQIDFGDLDDLRRFAKMNWNKPGNKPPRP